MTAGTRTIRAARGAAISCKGWPQEAALRMTFKLPPRSYTVAHIAS